MTLNQLSIDDLVVVAARVKTALFFYNPAKYEDLRTAACDLLHTDNGPAYDLFILLAPLPTGGEVMRVARECGYAPSHHYRELSYSEC